MEEIANALVDQTVSVSATDDKEKKVQVPLLSGWVTSQAEFALYPGLDVELIEEPLPPQLAAIVKRSKQAIYIDRATAQYMHGKEARFDWRLPRAGNLPPRLISVGVSRAPLPREKIVAQNNEGRGEILLGTTFREFISRYKATEFPGSKVARDDE